MSPWDAQRLPVLCEKRPPEMSEKDGMKSFFCFVFVGLKFFPFFFFVKFFFVFWFEVLFHFFKSCNVSLFCRHNPKYKKLTRHESQVSVSPKTTTPQLFQDWQDFLRRPFGEVIFSRKGAALPEQIAGGDLDGDLYWVSGLVVELFWEDTGGG